MFFVILNQIHVTTGQHQFLETKNAFMVITVHLIAVPSI